MHYNLRSIFILSLWLTISGAASFFLIMWKGGHEVFLYYDSGQTDFLKVIACCPPPPPPFQINIAQSLSVGIAMKFDCALYNMSGSAYTLSTGCVVASSARGTESVLFWFGEDWLFINI